MFITVSGSHSSCIFSLSRIASSLTLRIILRTPSPTMACPIQIDSYETALCLIPPEDLWPSVEKIRLLYDKAYRKWPPHINLAYPFVKVDALERVSELIVTALENSTTSTFPYNLKVVLDTVGVFKHRSKNTIFITGQDDALSSQLVELRRAILQILGHPATEAVNYRMHMTVAQTDGVDSPAFKYLEQKAKLLPRMFWNATSLAILVRESAQAERSRGMRLWGVIDLQSRCITRVANVQSLYHKNQLIYNSDSETEFNDEPSAQPRPTFQFSGLDCKWKLLPEVPSVASPGNSLENLVIASYNVLAEFLWPPKRDRYQVLAKTLLANNAQADILVLQEVTDDFHSFILCNSEVQSVYKYSSHGPPNQIDMDPLPSHLNIVVLSKYPFNWQFVPFKRRHKGSAIAIFPTIGKMYEDGTILPLVLGACHLTRGLADGPVAAKRNEIGQILTHIAKYHAENPCLLVGDFNIATSTYTIEAALLKKAISPRSVTYLAEIEASISRLGFLDSWAVARCEIGESSGEKLGYENISDTFEGEQGATFDPIHNPIAFESAGSGLNNRPQRYDRIFVRCADMFLVRAFNVFGTIPGNGEFDSGAVYPSDHWGIRCLLQVEAARTTQPSTDSGADFTGIKRIQAPGPLCATSELKDTLSRWGGIPLETEDARRKLALELLRGIVTQNHQQDSGTAGFWSKSTTILVPVGSYALGVWSSTSDIDCLCIGPFSSGVFFAVTTQCLRKSESSGIKIIRRIKAASGTMLELDVLGVKIDLHYCAAAYISQG
jgi:hypothetical protein